MPVSETQIQLYALTKKIMDLSEKYLSTTIVYERKLLLERIEETNDKLEELGLQYKEEQK